MFVGEIDGAGDICSSCMPAAGWIGAVLTVEEGI